MGVRQSKRSVEISGTPKKGELENGGAVEEGRLERIEEGDLAPKVALNGTGPHAETPATEEAAPLVNGDHKVEPSPEEEKKRSDRRETRRRKKEEDESTTEQKTEETPTTTPEKCEKKKKDKPKKKWSFRSISFSRKDKNKPSLSKEDSKNGDVEPVAEVVEAEAAAVAAPVDEAVPVKDDEKKEETPATPVGEEDKKEEKPAETPAPATEAAPAETPAEPTPAAVEAPTEAAAGEPAPAPAAETPEESVKEPESEAAPPTPAPEATPEPTPAEPAAESTPAPAEPVVESVPEPEQAAPVEIAPEAPAPVAAEVITAVIEEKLEEIPPPLPASPPPTEAPPPTPVAPIPATAPIEISLLQLGNEADVQENDVAGGGGESMAELPPGDVEPVLDVGLDEKEIETTMVNGVCEESQKVVCDITEKIGVVKTILSEDTETHLVTESTEIVTATPKTEE